MSFHAYLRKLTGGADKWGAVFNFPVWLLIISDSDTVLISCRGKFAALENISCKIKSGCEGHPPWPEGICTKCQPSAITLNRQVCHGNKCGRNVCLLLLSANMTPKILEANHPVLGVLHVSPYESSRTLKWFRKWMDWINLQLFYWKCAYLLNAAHIFNVFCPC